MIWASDCQICNAEAATYARFHESQREKGVGVLGVSMDGQDNKAAALAFIERHDLPFPNLIGEPGMISLYYASLTQESLRGTPTFLIFDPDGEPGRSSGGCRVSGGDQQIHRQKECSTAGRTKGRSILSRACHASSSS